MPTHTGDNNDVLDKLMDMLAGNGDISEDTRRKIQAEVLYEILSRVRQIEKESPAGVFRRKPIQTILVIAASFILLHEFAVFINVGVIMTAAARLLGVPIP